MRYPGFCSGDYTSQSTLADIEKTYNWYSEVLESPYAHTREALYPTPGFTSFVQVTDVGGRALATMNGRTFGVMGGGVYEVFVTGTATRYGSVAQDNNPAQIAFNGTVGNQALVGSGSNGYALNLATNTLSQVLTGKATQVGMLDGYGIAFDNSTGRIWVSALNDVTSWDPAQFVVRTAAPDQWKAMLVNPPDIWLLGSLSGDVWYDAGTFPFPFAARIGLNFKYGIVAPFSIAAFGPSVLWLSQTTDGSGIVVRTQGYAPVRISNYSVETAIATYARSSTISDAEALIYQDRGHTFYCLRFPTANATWVFDLELNLWHQRGYWNPMLNQFDAWRPRVHTFAFGQHLTADPTSNTIATMDVNNATELDGTAIRRLRRVSSVFREDQRILIRRLEVLCEPGTSNLSGAGSNALMMYRNSDDGGRTYHNERTATIGLLGQYGRPGAQFHRLGIPRNRVDEITVSDPITSWRIVDAYIDNFNLPTRQAGR